MATGSSDRTVMAALDGVSEGCADKASVANVSVAGKSLRGEANMGSKVLVIRWNNGNCYVHRMLWNGAVILLAEAVWDGARRPWA